MINNICMINNIFTKHIHDKNIINANKIFVVNILCKTNNLFMKHIFDKVTLKIFVNK